MSLSGKIYKIIHARSNFVYVGSTFNTLNKRFGQHKSQLLRGLDSREYKIILIKEYKVIDKNHLEAYEQLWINKLKCINVSNTINFRKFYTFINKDKLTEYKHNWYEKNKEKIKEQKRIYNERNKDKMKEKKKEYYEKNKEKIREQHNIYTVLHKDKIKEIRKEYRENNKDKLLKAGEDYRKENRELLREKQKEKKECKCGKQISKANWSKHLKICTNK